MAVCHRLILKTLKLKCPVWVDQYSCTRRLRVEEIGVYHIINRGVERRDIFLSANDRDRFIKIIDESSILYKFTMYSFYLMDNLYHF